MWAAALPFAMNTAGWLPTESGRQPWVVQGILLTRNGVSPSVSTATIAVSLGIFVALYGALAVIDFLLMLHCPPGTAREPRQATRRRPRNPVPAIQY